MAVLGGGGGGGGARPPVAMPVYDLTFIGIEGLSSVVALRTAVSNTGGITTVLDVQGSGIWEFGGLISATNTSTMKVRITIDGVVVYDVDAPGDLMTRAGMQVGTAGQTSEGVGISMANIPFNESLKIEAATVGSGAATYVYRYYMTSGVLAAHVPYVEPLSTADIEA